MLNALEEDYIVTARAAGIPENRVYYKHALRNAILPVTTYLGIRIAIMFSGAVLIETVFSWPGMGKLLYDSMVTRDYPTIMGLFFFAAVLVVVVTLIVDLLYGYIDPRVKYR